MSEPFFAVRVYRPDLDARFVHEAWLASNRYSPRVRGMSYATYEAEWRPIIARLVERSSVLVAHVAGEDDALLGFACYGFRDDKPLVHQAYVKREARRIAKVLLASLLERPAVFTHWPVVRGELPVPSNWKYNPEVIYRDSQ